MNRGRLELRAWCQRVGLDRAAIAGRLGLSKPYLCQLLLGEREPGKETMLRIEQAAGIPMRAWLEPLSVTDQQAEMLSENARICKQLTMKRVS